MSRCEPHQPTRSSSEKILLRPRPYAQSAGTLLLLPLLPRKKPLKPLPVEIWSDIFAFAFSRDADDAYKTVGRRRLSLLLVCKNLKVSFYRRQVLFLQYFMPWHFSILL